MYLGRSPSSGAFIKLDSIQSQFNSVLNTFALTAGGNPVTPSTAQNLIIVLNGVMQEPGVAYNVSGSNIIFSAAVTTASTFYGILLGNVNTLNTVFDGAITTSKLEASLFSNLVMKDNIKTINGSSVLGSGDLTVATQNKADGGSASAVFLSSQIINGGNANG